MFFIAQVLNCTALQAEVLSTSTQSALPNEGEMHHAHSRQQAKMVYKNIRTKQYQKGYHHIVSFWADSAWDVDICWAFVTNKESYCRKHGILWSFRRMHFVPHRHFQESLALRIAIVSELLLSAHNRQVTYMDFDTFIVDHAVDIDSIYEEADAEHEFPCTVYVQADPYVVNSGFWSVMNTAWVREEFMPKWDALRRKWDASGAAGSTAREPDQKSFMAAILHFALRERNIDSDICGFEEFDLRSTKVQNATNEVKKWVNSLPAGYPGEDFYVRKKHPIPGLHKDLLSYVDGFRKHTSKSLDGAVLHDCYNWAFDHVLGLSFRNRSFPVGTEDGICFLGFEGMQVNRQHFFPPAAVRALHNFTFSEAAENRHHAYQYGKGYSQTLFNFHAHLEKNDPNFCTSTVAANDFITNMKRSYSHRRSPLGAH